MGYFFLPILADLGYIQGMTKKITQKGYAASVGLHHVTISRILRGDRNPSVKLSRLLERSTGIPKEVWIFGTAAERREAWKKFQREGFRDE